MSFDRDCSTYWCDTCGRELYIDYEESSDLMLTLHCRACGAGRFFAADVGNDMPGRDDVPKTSQITSQPTYRIPCSEVLVPHEQKGVGFDDEIGDDHFGENQISDPYVEQDFNSEGAST